MQNLSPENLKKEVNHKGKKMKAQFFSKKHRKKRRHTVNKQNLPQSEKIKQIEPKPKKRKKISIAIATAEQISSNWEKLKQELPPPRKKKKPNLPHENQNHQQKTPEIWFDDVDEVLLDKEDFDRDEETTPKVEAKVPKYDASKALVKTKAFKGPTRLIAMDCEMVGVGAAGKESILGRVSIVNHFGQCIYDKFVKPTEPVTDYRTEVSGLRPEDLEKGEDFKTVQKDVSELLKGRILIGHALHNDLKVLFLDHPRSALRDTAKYKPFKKIFGGKTPSLKRLTQTVLGVKVQEGEHSSIQDAQAAMRLYTMNLKKWEESERIGRVRKKNRTKKKKKKTVNNV